MSSKYLVAPIATAVALVVSFASAQGPKPTSEERDDISESIESTVPKARIPRRWVEFPLLWQEAAPSGLIGNADVELRGWNSGGRYRPGVEVSPLGFDTFPWMLPEGNKAFELSVSEEVAAGPMFGSNVDVQALMSKYPNTRELQLAGNKGRYFNKVTVFAGGSIVDDRLRFYLEAVDQRTSRLYLGAVEPESNSRPRYTMNLTWQPDRRTIITAGGRGDFVRTNNAGLSAWDAASGARRREIDELSAVVTARRQLDDRNEVYARYDIAFTRVDSLPVSGLGVPSHFNLDTYQQWGNYPFKLRSRSLTQRLDIHWSTFLDALLSRQDSHTVTFGAQLETRNTRDDETRTGGFTFVDYAAKTDEGAVLDWIDSADRKTWELFSSDRGDELHGRTRQANVALYAKDKIQIGSRVILTPAVRLERFSGGFIDGPTVWTTSTVAPRLSWQWLLTEGGSLKLIGSVGRHYQNLDPSILLRVRDGAAWTPLEYWDWGGDPSMTPDPSRQDPRWSLSRRFPALAGELKDVKHPYADRLGLAIWQSLESLNLQASVRYEYRRYRNMLAIYDGTASVWDPTSNPGGTYQARQYGLAYPGPYDRAAYYDLRPGAQANYVIGNPEDAWREFHTVELSVRQDPLRWLTLRGSGAYTIDHGNLDSLGGISSEWRDPNGKINNDGKMAGYDPWRARLSATADLPARIRVTMDYTFRAGMYYSRRFRITPDFGPRAFVYDARGRGGYQLASRQILDLKVDWILPVGGPGRWGSWVQVFNLLNSSTVTGLREQANSFRRITGIEAPREIHLGVRYDI